MWLPTHRRLKRRLDAIEKRLNKVEGKAALTIAIRKSRKQRRELIFFKIVPGVTGVAATIVILGQAFHWF